MPPRYQRPQPSKQTVLTHYGGWIPADPAVYEAFFKDLLRAVDPSKPHTPAIQAFKDAIDADPELVDLFEQTFLQVSPESQVKTFEELLHCMDKVTVAAPKYQVNRDENGNIVGGEPIGVPLYLLLDLLSNTGAGYDLFRKVKFNAAIKKVLDVWGEYLRGPDSNDTLNDSDEGWFGKLGLESLEVGRGIFNETYLCPNYAAVNRGFASWDAFFTRKFQDGVRPIDRPPAPFQFIYNACESTVYRIQNGIQEHDKFWLKGQPYSIYDMLARRDDEVARSFINGTVYQAFLSPQDYHRWHTPVDGTIRQVQIVPGTYYAALPDEGAEQSDPDFQPGDPRGAIIRSQAWLTEAATRALIYIEADNKDIGLIVFIGVGMVEVSTCEITVREGQKVSAGDEIGMFHFGGSSHALVFGPDVKLEFFDHVQINKHLHVNRPIAGIQT